MRHLFSRYSMLVTLALVLAAFAPPARAGIQYISTDDDDNVSRTFAGDSDHLPVRPTLHWQEAVAWARTMPAVQLAMQTCAARGYQALSAHDSAYVSIDPPATVVVFPYRRPGLVLPTYHYGQPLLMVMTSLDREGVPATRVTAGVLILDAQSNAVFAADSLPEYATSDASFDVAMGGAGEGVPGEKRYTVIPAWPGGNPEPKSAFNKFVRCWGLALLASCLRPLLNFMRTPAGYVLEFTQPEDLGFYMALCMLGTGIGCLWAVE
jgi:hypothetical protein